MGDEIVSSQFSDADYSNYWEKLSSETRLLRQMFQDQLFEDGQAVFGLEQEAWIVDHECQPKPENQFLLDQMNSELLSPELAKFNIELNVTPQLLARDGLQKVHRELEELWTKCEESIAQKNLKLQMIGILPTVKESDLTLKYMSEMKRYRALNEQVLKSRNGSPIRLDIVGNEHLKCDHNDVMLESAATSFQLHRQIPPAASARYYNTSIILSAITVAISANSPYLFESELWDETRIPLFEQAVEVGGYGSAARGPIRRVTFGSGYAKETILECFNENLAHYPVLLPVKFDSEESELRYLRMHNGTIWRWNRPLIGFDENKKPHLRIEHRVISAGPTVIDEMANAVFFTGLQEYYATIENAPENKLSFSDAKSNFYSAAQHGLETKIRWLNGEKISITNLVLNELIANAKLGLRQLDVDDVLINEYLHIIQARVRSGQTGAIWQKKYVAKHGRDVTLLAKAYWQNQKTGAPVHQWLV